MLERKYSRRKCPDTLGVEFKGSGRGSSCERQLERETITRDAELLKGLCVGMTLLDDGVLVICVAKRGLNENSTRQVWYVSSAKVNPLLTVISTTFGVLVSKGIPTAMSYTLSQPWSPYFSTSSFKSPAFSGFKSSVVIAAWLDVSTFPIQPTLQLSHRKDLRLWGVKGTSLITSVLGSSTSTFEIFSILSSSDIVNGSEMGEDEEERESW